MNKNKKYQYFKSSIDDQYIIFRFNALTNHIDYLDNRTLTWNDSCINELNIDPNNEPSKSFTEIDLNEIFLEMI